MSTQNNPPENFESIYKTIHDNCENLSPGYEQINYLKKVIAECVRFREYELMYEDEIIDDDELNKIMPKVTQHFFSLIEDPTGEFTASENLKDVLMLYHMENGKQDYNAFFKNAGNLIHELNGDFKNKEENFRTTILNESEHLVENRIKITSSQSDIVRIFEAMKKAGIVSLKTSVQQFAEIFFNAISDKIVFEKNYNAIKNRIKREHSSSNSVCLVNFIKILCEESFKRKEIEIDEIMDHLALLQKNII